MVLIGYEAVSRRVAIQREDQKGVSEANCQGGGMPSSAIEA